MKVTDLNEDLITELNMQDIKDGIKKVSDSAKETVGVAVKVLSNEIDDNSKAFAIFKRKLSGHEVSEAEFKAAWDQMFKDNVKLLTIAGIGILPGSAIALPLMMKIAKKFNIALVPEKTFK